jgi:hypothetical protein
MRWGEDPERHVLQHGVPNPKKKGRTLEEFAARFVDGHARARWILGQGTPRVRASMSRATALKIAVRSPQCGGAIIGRPGPGNRLTTLVLSRARRTDDEPTGAHLGQRQFTAATYISTRLKQFIGVHAAPDALSGRACMKYNDR